VEQDKPKKSESVGQTLPQLPWKQKRGDLKIFWKTKFRPYWRIFVFGGHFFTLVTMATAAILNFFNPPKAATHYGGYSYKVS
jgi:hypothetical protein